MVPDAPGQLSFGVIPHARLARLVDIPIAEAVRIEGEEIASVVLAQDTNLGGRLCLRKDPCLHRDGVGESEGRTAAAIDVAVDAIEFQAVPFSTGDPLHV